MLNKAKFDPKVFRHIGNSLSSLRKKDEEKVEKRDIDYITFDFMSEKEIKDWSVVEITSTKLSGMNTLFDPKMGPVTLNDNCETCHQSSKVCPGHCGRITMPRKVPHPLRLKLITQYLSLFCYNCYRLVVLEEKMQLANIHNKTGENKFKALLTERDNSNTCPHCSFMLPTFSFDDDCKIYIKYKQKSSLVSIEKIDTIFGNIPPCDIAKIGFNPERVHPSNLLIKSLLVLPPCARPPVRNDTGQNHDDLTYKYQEILKHIEAYNKTSNAFEKNKSYDSICFNIKTYMDNSKGKSKNQGQKRVIKCIKKRMTSKTGLIRGNLQGKRVNFCARSVISPEANGWVDELVVPEKFAKNITFPVKVNAINIKKCQQLVDENKVNSVTRDGKQIFIQYKCFTKGFELRDNDIIKRPLPDGSIQDIFVYGTEDKPELKSGDSVLRYNHLYKNVEAKKKKEDFILQEGDVIERFLQDGDWTLFNRQPTLWKYSMRAFKIKIRPGKTFRFNLACTQSFNADFDGDEMNAFFAQSELTKAEAQEIISVGRNFMSSQDSRPVLSIKQDAMTGGYKLTYGRVIIRKEVFMDAFTHEKYPMEMYNAKRAHVIAMYKREGLYHLVKTPRYFTLEQEIMKLNEKKRKTKADKERMEKLVLELEEEKEICDSITEDSILYTGHTYFSFLLPNDFNYVLHNGMAPDGKPVMIKSGVMFTGTLNKAAMGSACGSLIHHMWKDYGEEKACWFVSMYQIMINFWLCHEGFSIGLEDCIPKNTDLIDNEIRKAFLRAQAILTSEKDEEIKENRVVEELHKATGIGQKYAKDALGATNNLVSMIRSGSKGDWLNITQITGVIGQQFVASKRIEKTFGGRTLPYYPKNGVLLTDSDKISEEADIDAVIELFNSRGFVLNNFYKGIRPQEFIFHAGGGRVGLIDSSLSTASSGYTQRKLVKYQESLTTTYVNTVVQCNDQIIQFDYGGDNCDASRLINVSTNTVDKEMSFIHVAHTVDRLNSQVELGL